MKFEPNHDWILIKPDPLPTTTKGGLAIPTGFTEAPCRGTVISTGPGGENPISVEAGNHVQWQRFAGIDIELGDEKFVLVRDSEIMGWLKE